MIMYYEYWGLKKPAFDNVPDPSMYVDCHTSMENAIAETLFAIEEGDECVAVIVGDVGLGKTMSIRMIIDSLDQDKYKIALITNPGVSFVQLLQEIIGQLSEKQCTEKRKVNLLEIFNRLLFSTFAEGKKLLIFIDEANAITPVNLENLRLLTNMQSDKRNLFTMVLAGQIEFAKRLEHPKRANLFQRVGTYCRIDKLESTDKVRRYVETRLALAGATKKVFADDAFEKLWEQSDHGVPRLVNKLSKLCLKAGETNQFESISGEIVEQIGSRFHKLTGPAIQKRRSRKCAPANVLPQTVEEEILADGYLDADHETDHEEALAGTADAEIRATADPDRPEPAGEQALPAEPAFLVEEEDGEPGLLSHHAVEAGKAGPVQEPAREPAVPEAVAPQAAAADAVESDSEAEMSIGQVKVKILFPSQLLQQSLASTQEHRLRLAGGLAAETLKKHPQLITPLSADPVPIWEEIRSFVLKRIDHASRMQQLG
jgi:type II secretory pathway predicted ATPase ExeA